jgi:pimeloyl-ACP methyl ester carboxylesterase
MQLTPVSIPQHKNGGNGGPELAGLLYTPDRPVVGASVVLGHGFTSGKYSMDSLASYLAMRGRTCLTYDAVGHKLGATGGEMMHMGQAAENMLAALAWMRGETEPTSVALVGHSMGAAAAIAAAAADITSPAAGARVAGICTLCMGVNPTAGFEGTLGAAMLLQRKDYVAGAPAINLLAGLDRLLSFAPQLGTCALPVLLVAARSDVLLPVENVRRLAEQIGESAEMRVIDAQHIDAPDKARGLVANWLQDLDAASNSH